MAFGDRKKKKYAEFIETASGEVVYVGKYYVYKPDNPLPYNRYRIALALCCTGAAALVAAAGLYRAPGMDRTLYVLLPYVILLGFTALMCYRGAKVVRAGNPLRAFDHRNALGPMQHWALASAVFAAILLDDADRPVYINLKLDPVEGEFLRGQYADIIPGYYSNKRCWNSIRPDGAVPDELLRGLLDKSYALVLAGFSKKRQRELTEGI